MFSICKEPGEEKKYYISVNIVIYRQLLGKYPDFLQDFEKDSHLGYTTKFSFLVPGMETLSEIEALARKVMCEERYGDILKKCEETGDWSKSPLDFSKMTLLASA